MASPVHTAARCLLLTSYRGILSTLSADTPGYPFGSVVNYCLNRDGLPIILISRIAQHTRNIQADPRISLIVHEEDKDDIQSAARLTCLADTTILADYDEDSALRYYGFFPEGRKYHDELEFDFYRLDPVRARYIGGFGEIHWIPTEQLIRANPFDHDEESSMVRHMNADHRDAMTRYCEAADIASDPSEPPAMAGVDGEGFDLRLGHRIIRFTFDEPVTTSTQVREKLVAMAKGSA